MMAYLLYLEAGVGRFPQRQVMHERREYEIDDVLLPWP